MAGTQGGLPWVFRLLQKSRFLFAGLAGGILLSVFAFGGGWDVSFLICEN